ncbi:MAG: 3-oxoacyl-[acyl-carrier-protein] reductase [Candidatus Omnitrophica bacterium]|nr:3-oxoacyl-[acyl-carrier-protein] reductase [Candidatus Omnitrophota bacterium]MCM8797882.1 3-oxoacyl-[acyl-carrier-protein] reductase [Candidatus Omnitrophota bacterium]
MLLSDKVAIITGGARGIGKEIALRFVQEGAKIVIWDINIEELEKAKSEIGKFSPHVSGYKVDVSKGEEIEKTVEDVLDNFKRIDILINNAGITRDALILRMSEEDWERVIAVNLKSVFNCTRIIAKVMLKQREGRIVNISSIIGLIGNAGQSNYAASKAGIIGFTKSVAKELASRGITVNAIAPGFIQTEMTEKLPQEIKEEMLKRIPLGRFGTPKDIAEVALFLSADASRYITGQVIVVDGGMT